MPRIVVTDAVTGKVEETVSFGVATQKVKKRVRERDAAAAAPPPAEACAVREEEAPPPRQQKAAPPAAQKGAKQAHNSGAAAAEAPASRQPKAAKKPKGGDDRPNLAALPVEEQARALWESYKAECGGSFLEEEAFAPEHVNSLPPGPSLQGRLKAATPDWRDTLARPPPGAPPAAPSVLVIAGAALRVLELIRELPEFNKGCRVAKLFSRHIKPEEQAESLAEGPVCIAVGTPARIDKLLAMGALSLAHLRLLVLDMSRDAKLRCILDIPETRRDTWQLWRGHLASRVAAGDTRVTLL